ncbi:MAG: alanine--tRNA ligase [Runella sp.]
MTSHEIRRAFLDFFRSKDHLIVPSAPLVAKNDPTLMFNNSGMAQFKDFFLGNGTPPHPRIADTQKCLRVSGKHNDLEDVGFDTYHHTMFEMLGNWSFGDYFKKEALAWSWELLTEVYKLPKDRIYVSVFGGDEKDGVPFDQEAWDIWKGILGGDERIILGSKKDNFWEMGDVGPCGPCSEIHIDLRDQEEVDKIGGKELVNADHPQVIEIWNNVFMQFERKADGSLVSLPAKHVDTGMGFERLCMAIQGKKSNYDTDIFQNTIQVIEKMSGKKYGVTGTLNTTDYTDIAMRVIADHLRAVSFAIADGQLPSNAKAGYVIRRILRRAIRYGYSYLGFTEPFMCQLVPVLAAQFKDVFPELQEQVEFVSKVVEEEEKNFLRTLDAGIKRFDALIQSTSNKAGILSGEVVFELSDTYGFPVDLTALLAKEKGLKIDYEGYEKALAEQKARSRQDAAKEAGDWVELNEGHDFEFVGYDTLECEAQIIKYRKVKTKAGEEYHIVLDCTPFYAEMGGQVGDTGTLTFQISNESLMAINIVDTKKENDLFVHIARDKNLEALLNTQHSKRVVAKVNPHRRRNIMRNHTATHLMLAAMRRVLGNHIIQKGSFQNDEVTRFDFSHFAKVTDDELAQIEEIVNEKIRENIPLKTYVNLPLQKALEMGATATFGEKYGDFVRVVEFDPSFSVELCGGTHVPATGEIGLFKFISEGSVSAGTRRVEAITGEAAQKMVNQELAMMNEVRALFKGQKDLVKAVQSLMNEKSALQKRIEVLENEKLAQVKQSLLATAKTENGMTRIIAQVEVPNADALKSLCYQLKEVLEIRHTSTNLNPLHHTSYIIVLATILNDKPQLAIMLSDDLVAAGKHAGNMVKELAKEIRGGGGGQPFFATAGGSDVSGLEKVLQKAWGL